MDDEELYVKSGADARDNGQYDEYASGTKGYHGSKVHGGGGHKTSESSTFGGAVVGFVIIVVFVGLICLLFS